MKTLRLIVPILSLLCVALLQGQTAANGSPVGSWKWSNHDTIDFKQDLTVWGNNKQIATWKWIDETKREFSIAWPGDRKDTLKLSPDGVDISGTDADGGPVSGHKIPAK